jgi:tRNA (mo5U34)-methyltransferase
MVFFFGVLYHLRHPLLALERVFGVCTGTLLMQSALYRDESDQPLAEFHPFGIDSGPPEKPIHDPTSFWFPNPAVLHPMLRHVGFEQVERLSPTAPAAVGGVFRAKSAGRDSRGFKLGGNGGVETSGSRGGHRRSSAPHPRFLALGPADQPRLRAKT